MNLLRAEARAVVVPYDEGEETEQWFRSERMGKMGLLSVVPTSRLSAETMAAAVTEAWQREAGARPAIDLEGAANAAATIAAMAGGADE